MEVNNVTGAYTSAAKVVEQEEEKDAKRVQTEEKTEETRGTRAQKDEVDISETTDFDETKVLEKANNYVANILANPKLTDESKELIRQYITTFDAAKFAKMYGPFSTTAEISAAMYAVTSHMVKYQED